MKKIILLFLSCILFSSCGNIMWFDNLDTKIEDELKVPVYFYLNYPSDESLQYTVKYYTVGSVIKQNDFPQSGSKELFNLKPGYDYNGKWMCPDFYATASSQTTSSGGNAPAPKKQIGEYIDFSNADKTVNKITVPPKDIGTLKIYASETDFTARTDTPYTFILRLEKLYSDDYDEYVYHKTGTTDTSFIVYTVDEYENRLIGIFASSDNDDESFTISGDGSTKVIAECKRKICTLIISDFDDVESNITALGFNYDAMNSTCNKIYKCGYELSKIEEDLKKYIKRDNFTLKCFSVFSNYSDENTRIFDSLDDYYESYEEIRTDFPETINGVSITLYPVWVKNN